MEWEIGEYGKNIGKNPLFYFISFRWAKCFEFPCSP
jgi:hypothetical protein